jgi:hypothetical protein
MFMDGDNPQPPVAFQQAKLMNTMVMAAAPVSLAVSNQLILNAYVEVASTRATGN